MESLDNAMGKIKCVLMGGYMYSQADNTDRQHPWPYCEGSRLRSQVQAENSVTAKISNMVADCSCKNALSWAPAAIHYTCRLKGRLRRQPSHPMTLL